MIPKPKPKLNKLQDGILTIFFPKDFNLTFQFPFFIAILFLKNNKWNDDFDTRRPKKFTINIDNQVRLRSKLIALAHELVHLKQWTKGEMYEYVRDANRYKWKNTVVNVKGIDYYDLPWEVEAHGREIGMYIRMCEHFKWSKEDWTKEYVPMYGDRKCGLTDILKKYENDLTKLTE